MEDLLAAELAGRRLKFLFFWGHTARGDGPGPWVLSQWWPAPFALDGVTYATAEHRMMVAKAELFGDDAAREKILKARSPGAAKAAGREVRNFDEDVWRAHRFAIVRDASVAKFGASPELTRYLLETGDRILVEASPLDRVWGIGLAADDERAQTPSRWRGENLLGFALMDAREALHNAS